MEVTVMPFITETVVKCCQCNIEKKTTNHWYVVIQEDGSITFMTWKKAVERGIPLSKTINADAVCGQGDAHKELDAFFVNIMKPVINISE
jgi:hypothetical protein